MDPHTDFPFTYVRDDTRRRIRVTARGTLARADFIAIVDRQAVEHTWSYALVYDLRMMPAAGTRDDADAVAAHVFRYLIAEGPRGPVAAVTTSASMIAAAQVYAFIAARAGVEVQVFWDLDEADRWIDERQRPPDARMS